jgi:hypothetical protein
MPAKGKHRKGYFKGKVFKYTLTAYESIQKAGVDKVTNKQLSKQLNISENTFYRIKSGKTPPKNTYKKLSEYFNKYSVYANHLNKRGELLQKAILKIRKDEKKGKIKKLTNKQVYNLTKRSRSGKELKQLEEIESLFEALYYPKQKE